MTLVNGPPDPRIFHITHVDNLPSIVAMGALLSDAARRRGAFPNQNIGHLHIKERRMRRAVPVAAKGVLGDYVPFYFCARSVMLCAIHNKHADYAGGQTRIVHLVSTVSRAVTNGRPWAFTDRHAELAYARFFDDLAELGQVRWDAMHQHYWTAVKEERQAEFLVHQQFDWADFSEIVVPTPELAAECRGRCHAAFDCQPRLVLLTAVPIEIGRGNLLTADVDALVNTVNTTGVMGKGLALQFKRAFPEVFRDYERACRAGEVEIGRMHVVERLASPRLIVNFPTKKHWRGASKLAYVEAGLEDLIRVLRERAVTSVAVPPLGCGLGGLQWSDVEPRIRAAFAQLPDARVLLYPPGDKPAPEQMVDRTKRPNVTPKRAAVLALIQEYASAGYGDDITLLEVQKLAYFLQSVGEDLQLRFDAHHYGPYAPNLWKALRTLEGHYTSGLGDGEDAPAAPLKLLPGAARAASEVLGKSPATLERLTRVKDVIEGFETPFGMELLATVHWVMLHEESAARDVEAAIDSIRRWSERKATSMTPYQIGVAWHRVREAGLLDADPSTRSSA